MPARLKMTMPGFVGIWCIVIGISWIKDLSPDINIFRVSFSKILSISLAVKKFVKYYFETQLMICLTEAFFFSTFNTVMKNGRKRKIYGFFFGTFNIVMRIGRKREISGEPCCYQGTGRLHHDSGRLFDGIRRVGRSKVVLVGHGPRYCILYDMEFKLKVKFGNFC